MASPQYKPWTFLRFLMALGALLLLASVFANIWAVRHAPHQGRVDNGSWNYLQGGNKSTVIWKPLEQEKALYRSAGYSVDWLDGHAFDRLRAVLGPYSLIFELIALRFYGLCSILPLVCCTALFGWAEGRVMFHEKVATFANLSATRFKIFTLLLVFCFAATFLFLTLPFGSELPIIGTIPLTLTYGEHSFWVTAPYSWAAFFAAMMFVVSYQMTANFGREI